MVHLVLLIIFPIRLTLLPPTIVILIVVTTKRLGVNYLQIYKPINRCIQKVIALLSFNSSSPALYPRRVSVGKNARKATIPPDRNPTIADLGKWSGG
jgi:hypothetical protein